MNGAKRPKWKRMEFFGMKWRCADGPPAYNPPIHKSNASRSLIDFINKLIPPINSLCLICEIVGREIKKDILTVMMIISKE